MPTFTVPLTLFRRMSLLCPALLLCASFGFAQNVPVRYPEGFSRGILGLRRPNGKMIASGDMRQIMQGDKVISWLIFNFSDGSEDYEETVFTQHGRFRLVSDHHIQKGPSFPHPMDMTVDVPAGTVTTVSGKGAKKKVETHHMNFPANIANGMVTTALKDMPPNAGETDLTMVAGGSSPRLVTLAVTGEGEGMYWVGNGERKARRFLIRIKIGGIAGVVAPIIGKQPEDVHAWFAEGVPPMMIRTDSQLYDGGPVWRIEVAEPAWHNMELKK